MKIYPVGNTKTMQPTAQHENQYVQDFLNLVGPRREPPSMTVEQLRELLSSVPPDYEIKILVNGEKKNVNEVWDDDQEEILILSV